MADLPYMHDAQVLVLYDDVLGITHGHKLKITYDFLAGRDSMQEAIRAYVEAVKSGSFPDSENTVSNKSITRSPYAYRAPYPQRSAHRP